MPDFRERLETYLILRGRPAVIDQLTPDASTREYFRIQWDDATAIACVYPEPFVAAEQNYLDVTNVFLSAGLPVAKIYDWSENMGVIIQEDLGDVILRDVLERSNADGKDQLINEAIGLISKIQAATPAALEMGSVCTKLKFDAEKLLWELEFFKTHYFETFKQQRLPAALDAGLQSEFAELAAQLETFASVLCHRDFHAANLMIDAEDRLRIIDHQDARIGSATYDLVSLLLDRVTVPPDAEWLAEKRTVFLKLREAIGLPRIDEADFAREFRLQTIQRCLKAVGTFSFQSVNRGKTYFIPFIRPMFQIVLRAAENVDDFPVLRRLITEQIAED